ncbi:hypothetical protein OESDEN_02263 [Oesophagostomum dentatum]|uniref:Uncharacterized protein n=1 Tax=Oesophagostomum dentatum TaxID=61180 RepID=A0A0B1TPK9_OESDE|nr:hypothetical protein OESDEN_02263 [Oesophagostomum dentatum]
MESILTRSFRKISPIMRYRGHIFSSNNVTLYNNKKCSFLGYVRMSRQLAIKIVSHFQASNQ